jgi:hypothetical protein
MKVIIDGRVYDPEQIPIVLVFENDAERKYVAARIGSMQDREAVRAYAQYPDTLPPADIQDTMLDAIKKSGYVG